MPRADASLSEIHATFLATHKNVRINADDAAIARVNGASGGGSMDIDVMARNASIAHLNLDGQAGRIDLALPTIAWDEDLIEIDLPQQAEAHPCPTDSACLVHLAGAPRHLRLLALEECVLGRSEPAGADAQVQLMHFGVDGAQPDGLTRRLSARHAIIRRGRDGFEIEDVSRYGVLLDGVWPGKHQPVPLRLGMRIELTASIKGIVVLEVSALLAHGVILRRIDQGARQECFMLLEPECRPPWPLPAAQAAQAPELPLVFHEAGGFWHLDRTSGQANPLTPTGATGRLAQMDGARFAAGAYPERWTGRGAGGDRRRAHAERADA